MPAKTVEETLDSQEEYSNKGGDQILADAKDDWSAREIGALWVRESASSGARFMSGEITIGGQKVDVVVYKNKFKKATDKSPEFRIYLSKPKEA